MYLLGVGGKKKKATDKADPIDRAIVSYLAGGLSRMSGITTGECSCIAAARSSDLEMDLCSLFHLSHSVVLPLIWF